MTFTGQTEDVATGLYDFFERKEHTPTAIPHQVEVLFLLSECGCGLAFTLMTRVVGVIGIFQK